MIITSAILPKSQFLPKQNISFKEKVDNEKIDLYPLSDKPQTDAFKKEVWKYGREDTQLTDIYGKTRYFYKTEFYAYGTHPSFWAEDKENGKLYYVKRSSNSQNRSEVLAGKLYELAGLNVPETELVFDKKGKSYVRSRYVANLKSIFDNYEAAHPGFCVDAWLANWDVVGSNNGHLKDGKAVRLDFGGALDYHGIGAKKPYGSIVKELQTLLIFEINNASCVIFRGISADDFKMSLQRVKDINKEDITNVFLKYKNRHNNLLKKILNRKEYLEEVLSTCDKVKPQQYEMTLKYIQRLVKEIPQKTLTERILGCINLLKAR